MTYILVLITRAPALCYQLKTNDNNTNNANTMRPYAASCSQAAALI